MRNEIKNIKRYSTTQRNTNKTVNNRDTGIYVENPNREKPRAEEAENQFTIILECYSDRKRLQKERELK